MFSTVTPSLTVGAVLGSGAGANGTIRMFVPLPFEDRREASSHLGVGYMYRQSKSKGIFLFSPFPGFLAFSLFWDFPSSLTRVSLTTFRTPYLGLVHVF